MCVPPLVPDPIELGKSMSDPVIAQKSPYAVELEEGKTYAWCACGRSGNQPSQNHTLAFVCYGGQGH